MYSERRRERINNSEGKDTRASDELLLSGALVYISGWLAHLVPLLHRLGAAPADVRIGPLRERLFGGLGLARGDFEEGWWQGLSLSSLVFCIAIQPEVEAHSARQLVVMRSGTLRHAMSGSIPIIAVCINKGLSVIAHIVRLRSVFWLQHSQQLLYQLVPVGASLWFALTVYSPSYNL